MKTHKQHRPSHGKSKTHATKQHKSHATPSIPPTTTQSQHHLHTTTTTTTKKLNKKTSLIPSLTHPPTISANTPDGHHKQLNALQLINMRSFFTQKGTDSTLSPIQRLKLAEQSGLNTTNPLTTKFSLEDPTHHPTTSTKFQKKIKVDDTTAATTTTTTKAFDVTPIQAEKTTWDFHSLTNETVLDVKASTQQEARHAVTQDEEGFVVETLPRLLQLPEQELLEIAFGTGKYALPDAKKAKKKRLTKSQREEEAEYQAVLQEEKDKIKHHNATGGVNADGDDGEEDEEDLGYAPKKKVKTALLELDDSLDVLAAFRKLDPENNIFRGFTDPVVLPRHITTPKLVNPLAGRALGLKYLSQADQISADFDTTNEKHLHEYTMRRSRLKEQSALWFAKASFAGDADSSYNMAQLCEDKLNLLLRLYDELDEDDDQDNNNNNDNATDDGDDGKGYIDAEVDDRKEMSDETKLECEIAYDEATKALMPRLAGKQFQGIDFKTTHPFISTIYYFEKYIEQSNSIYALTQYCEWLLGMDELFGQVIDDEELQTGLGKYTEKNIDDLLDAPRQEPVKKHNNKQNENDDDNHHLSPADLDPTLYQEVQLADPQTAESSDGEADGDGYDEQYFHPSTFLGIYFQFYLRPLALHPVYGPDSSLLLARLLRIYGDHGEEADELEAAGRANGGLTIEERAAEYQQLKRAQQYAQQPQQ